MRRIAVSGYTLSDGQPGVLIEIPPDTGLPLMAIRAEIRSAGPDQPPVLTLTHFCQYGERGYHQATAQLFPDGTVIIKPGKRLGDWSRQFKLLEYLFRSRAFSKREGLWAVAYHPAIRQWAEKALLWKVGQFAMRFNDPEFKSRYRRDLQATIRIFDALPGDQGKLLPKQKTLLMELFYFCQQPSR